MADANLWLKVLAVACFAQIGLAASTTAPQPLPPDASVRTATALVKATFRDDYSNPAPKAKHELEDKLWTQAFDPKNDDATQYALLLEASRVAAGIGDLDTCLQAADEIARRYPQSGIAVRSQILENAFRDQLRPDEVFALGDAYLTLSDDSIRVGDFAAATRAADRAESIARRIGYPSLLARSALRKELARDFEQFSKGKDPQSSPRYGVFKCIVDDDWGDGLPMLAKSPDAQLAALVKRDTENPASPQSQLDLADSYSALGESSSHPAADRLIAQKRARFWYEKVLPEVGGLAQMHVAKQIAALRNASVMAASADQMVEMKKALVSTLWTWYDPKVKMTFTVDGHVSHIGMHGTYEVTGPRRVVLDTSAGIYVFRFDADLQHYASMGRGWGGERCDKPGS